MISTTGSDSPGFLSIDVTSEGKAEVCRKVNFNPKVSRKYGKFRKVRVS